MEETVRPRRRLTDDERKVLERVAEAIEHYGVFVFQKELDDANRILGLIREIGVAMLLETRRLQQGIYLIMLNEKPCTTTCRYDKCSGLEGEEQAKCINNCMVECMKEFRAKVVEVLRSHASRR